MEKRAPMSQSKEVREMFHARFDGCLVLKFDINFDRQTEEWTDERKSGRL